MQLTLGALQRVAAEGAGDVEGEAALAGPAVEAVLQAARQAPDAAVSNAALALLALLAQRMPEQTLHYVLEVTGVAWKI